MKQPESLQDYAVDVIRRNIQDGTFPLGSKLSPQHIASELNISATPVVAALNRLTTQGLVEILPRRGFIVKKFSSEDILNYFDTRIMMESWAAIGAAKNVERFPEIIAEMRELAVGLEQADLDNLDAIGRMESRFHHLFIQMAGNEQLTRLYDFNWGYESVFFIYCVNKISPKNFMVSLKEHKQILDILLSGDAAKLQSMVRKHLRFLDKAIDWYDSDGGHT